VWYLLNDTHLINKRIINNSKQLNTSIFPGHITIKHSLNRNQAEYIFEKYSKKEKPFFLRFGQPIQSSTTVGNNMFHAIEQPLKVCGMYIPNAHVSLAYRINGNAFTKHDVEKINTSTFNIIHSDFTLCLAHCFSENPSEWTILKKI
tara:strand:- start:1453 stop:1893 length:441 start_codon:yes stop_codon:yes gene_type:complete